MAEFANQKRNTMNNITKEEQVWLETEMNHIIESGANHIRIIEKIDRFLEMRKNDSQKIIEDAIRDSISQMNEIREKIDFDLTAKGISVYKNTSGKIEYVDPLSDEAMVAMKNFEQSENGRIPEYYITLQNRKKSFIELERERSQWSNKIFPEATAFSSLLKAEEEINEIKLDLEEKNPNVFEYVDALMCIFDSAQRAGFPVEKIRDAYEEKNRINIHEREWVKNPNNTYSHIKK